jgi:hypothetical protein
MEATNRWPRLWGHSSPLHLLKVEPPNHPRHSTIYNSDSTLNSSTTNHEDLHLLRSLHARLPAPGISPCRLGRQRRRPWRLRRWWLSSGATWWRCGWRQRTWRLYWWHWWLYRGGGRHDHLVQQHQRSQWQYVLLQSSGLCP